MNLDNTGNHPVSEVEIATRGTVVYLKGYGFIKVFKIVAKDGDIKYWATNNLGMSEPKLLKMAFALTIEEYHCGLPAVLRSRAQRNHIGLAIRAFLRLEHLLTTGISWFEAKVDSWNSPDS